MKKHAFFLLVLISVLIINTAFSSGNYGFQQAFSDAETVRAYFDGKASYAEAAEAFERLYDFLYKDAQEYVLNRNKGKIHLPNCPSVKQMNESNIVFAFFSGKFLTTMGFDPCGNCHPLSAR